MIPIKSNHLFFGIRNGKNSIVLQKTKIMQENTDNPILSRQVIEMITVAHEYCLFFEEADKHSKEEILSYFQKIAPLLYLKGAVLPDEVEADPEYAERFVNEEQWEVVFKILRDKFGDDDVYYVHDHNFDSQPTSLSDNMSDIYQDMKDFVMLYQKAPMQSKACAVAELQKLFENHWGNRILSALNTVHSLLYKDSIDPELLGDWDLE